MTTKDTHIKPLLTLAFGGLCISFAPIFVKMIDTTMLGPTAIGFWRTLIGAIILFLIAIIKGDKISLPKGVMFFAVVAGFLFFCDLFVWHRSIIYAGAGIATILGNTQVFWMALIGVVLFQEKLKPIFLLAVFTAFIGVVLLVGIGSIDEFSSRYIKGITFGLMTGIFYSTYMLTLKKAGHFKHRVSFVTLMAWTSLFSAIFLGGSMVIESAPMMPPDLYTWSVLFAVALIAQSIGWWVISLNLPKLKASMSGMVLLMQPILATIWGVLFFSESLTTLQILGAILTLTAIYFGTMRNATS